MPAPSPRSASLCALAFLALAAPASADVTVPDNQIVQGNQTVQGNQLVQSSQCVGFDCTAAEVFGFDTVRLKENNLRLHFDDTSASAGFPATDWRLEANDTGSGGRNRFSIADATAATTPFTVLGGAPNDALTVDGQGDIGIGTLTPDLDLHAKTGNTPAMRLEQTDAGGFTAQTWDIGANEANFFVRDLTGGSKLPFRIRPGAPTSSIDVAADGDVGIGTPSPEAPLHVRRDGAKVLVQATDGTAEERIVADLANNGPSQLRLRNTATDATSWLAGGATDGDFQLRSDAPEAPRALSLSPSGLLTTRGTLQQDADATRRQEAAPVDPAATLAKIDTLALSTFRIDGEAGDGRHLGPDGASFRSAFGLGAADTAIAPGDLAGVALAGVQALSRGQSTVNTRSDKRLGDLERGLARLRKDLGDVGTGAATTSGTARQAAARLDALERRVGGLDALSPEVAKVQKLERRLKGEAKKRRALARQNRRMAKRIRKTEKALRRLARDR